MQTGTSNNTPPIKMIDPVTTGIDEGKFLSILTELPDIAEEKIRIDLENSSTSVTIVASGTVKNTKKGSLSPLN